MNNGKRTKIVMLDTEKPSKNGIYLKPKMNIYNDIAIENHNNGIYDTKPQHLYFLSDEEIKDRDFMYNKLDDRITKFIRIPSDGNPNDYGYKKVISSTDKSLNLPRPSDSFIQKYIEEYNKGNIIEEVLVEYETNIKITNEPVYDNQGIIWSSRRKETITEILKVAPDNTITIKKIEERCKCCGKIL